MSDPITPEQFLARKVPLRSNKEFRAYTYAEVLSLLAEYGHECVFAEFERRGDIPTDPPASGEVGTAVPIKRFGEVGASWFCKCNKKCSGNHQNVDIHCRCGRVWRKMGQVVTLYKDITATGISSQSQDTGVGVGPRTEMRRRRESE